MRLRGFAAAGLIALAAAGCGIGRIFPGAPGAAGPVPRCEAVPKIEASPILYRATPIYVGNEMPAEAVAAWAAGKPGFEELWIDRDHNGWVTVAFSRDAAARQVELAAAFPDDGVVAVQVPWTMDELEQLQRRVVAEGQPLVVGSSIDVMHGVVTVNGGVLKADVVHELESRFAGTRICIEGIEPADAPAEGPQQSAGESWRLLADEDEVGGPYRTGIAADAAALGRLWAEIGLVTPLPTVDFEREVVVWFGAVHGSSCPRLRLDDVRYDAGRGVLHSVITSFTLGACTADAIGHAYVVAIKRSMLPAGPFVIQLQADQPPQGVLDSEPTIVSADLSVPGSVLREDQIQKPTPGVEEPRVEPGGYLEPGIPWQYRVSVRCGAEWLGRLNGVQWRTEELVDDLFLPTEWTAAVEPDDTLDLTITLFETAPRIEAALAGHSVIYVPTAETPPGCP